jgi:hypothetical protein
MEKLTHCLSHGVLEELDISSCQLKKVGMLAVGSSLNKSKLLKLHASNNECGDIAAICIAEALFLPDCKL